MLLCAWILNGGLQKLQEKLAAKLELDPTKGKELSHHSEEFCLWQAGQAESGHPGEAPDVKVGLATEVL